MALPDSGNAFPLTSGYKHAVFTEEMKHGTVKFMSKFLIDKYLEPEPDISNVRLFVDILADYYYSCETPGDSFLYVKLLNLLVQSHKAQTTESAEEELRSMDELCATLIQLARDYSAVLRNYLGKLHKLIAEAQCQVVLLHLKYDSTDSATGVLDAYSSDPAQDSCSKTLLSELKDVLERACTMEQDKKKKKGNKAQSPKEKQLSLFCGQHTSDALVKDVRGFVTQCYAELPSLLEKNGVKEEKSRSPEPADNTPTKPHHENEGGRGNMDILSPPPSPPSPPSPASPLSLPSPSSTPLQLEYTSPPSPPSPTMDTHVDTGLPDLRVTPSPPSPPSRPSPHSPPSPPSPFPPYSEVDIIPDIDLQYSPSPPPSALVTALERNGLSKNSQSTAPSLPVEKSQVAGDGPKVAIEVVTGKSPLSIAVTGHEPSLSQSSRSFFPMTTTQQRDTARQSATGDEKSTSEKIEAEKKLFIPLKRSKLKLPRQQTSNEVLAPLQERTPASKGPTAELEAGKSLQNKTYIIRRKNVRWGAVTSKNITPLRTAAVISQSESENETLFKPVRHKENGQARREMRSEEEESPLKRMQTRASSQSEEENDRIISTQPQTISSDSSSLLGKGPGLGITVQRVKRAAAWSRGTQASTGSSSSQSEEEIDVVSVEQPEAGEVVGKRNSPSPPPPSKRMQTRASSQSGEEDASSTTKHQAGKGSELRGTPERAKSNSPPPRKRLRTRARSPSDEEAVSSSSSHGKGSSSSSKLMGSLGRTKLSSPPPRKRMRTRASSPSDEENVPAATSHQAELGNSSSHGKGPLELVGTPERAKLGTPPLRKRLRTRTSDEEQDKSHYPVLRQPSDALNRLSGDERASRKASKRDTPTRTEARAVSSSSQGEEEESEVDILEECEKERVAVERAKELVSRADKDKTKHGRANVKTREFSIQAGDAKLIRELMSPFSSDDNTDVSASPARSAAEAGGRRRGGVGGGATTAGAFYGTRANSGTSTSTRQGNQEKRVIPKGAGIRTGKPERSSSVSTARGSSSTESDREKTVTTRAASTRSHEKSPSPATSTSTERNHEKSPPAATRVVRTSTRRTPEKNSRARDAALVYGHFERDLEEEEKTPVSTLPARPTPVRVRPLASFLPQPRPHHPQSRIPPPKHTIPPAPAQGNWRRIRFTVQETDYLYAGLKEFKWGNWKKILDKYPFHPSRTSTSLKDKARNLYGR